MDFNIVEQIEICNKCQIWCWVGLGWVLKSTNFVGWVGKNRPTENSVPVKHYFIKRHLTFKTKVKVNPLYIVLKRKNKPPNLINEIYAP